MDFTHIIRNGFKLLPPVFREAYKTAQVMMGYAIGERGNQIRYPTGKDHPLRELRKRNTGRG